MTSLRILDICSLAALSVGMAFAILSYRVPKRGWIGVVLLVVASVAWALIDARDSSQPSRTPMLYAFLIFAPVSVVYSFRARRLAPDRLPALAAFVGSFVVAAFLLFMVCGIVYSLFFI
jgi:hypothetical membrane protein